MPGRFVMCIIETKILQTEEGITNKFIQFTTHKAIKLSVNLENNDDEILKSRLNNTPPIIGGLLKDKMYIINDDSDNRQNKI